MASGGGRAEIQNAPSMPSLVARRYNPAAKSCYDRLVNRSKPKLVALIAAMRKPLTIPNVMI